MDQARGGPGQGDDPFGQGPDGEFARIAQVHGAGDLVRRVHEAQYALDEVVDEAEGPGLEPLAIEGDVLALQGLDDEVGNHPPVIGMHARAIGIEDPGDLDPQAMLAVIVEKQGLGAALALVVAGPDADRIDVTPIVFALRVDDRVAVDLAGGGLENPGAPALGETQHVDGAMHRRLGRLHGIELVVHRRGRAGQVVDLVDLRKEREGHVVPQQLEGRISHQVGHVATGTRVEIVDAEDLMSGLEEAFAEMRPDEARSTGDQYAFHGTGSLRARKGIRPPLQRWRPDPA